VVEQANFEVPADAYDRFMGRYSRHLSAQLADFARVEAGQRALDVGCGPGALTAELVSRLGAEAVAAVDPSESFVAALRQRQPGVRVEHASAEKLPFGDGAFDTALAQLVVHFMADPVAGLREMGRVTGEGGAVAACVWDHARDGMGPLIPYFHAVKRLDPARPDESGRAGVNEGHLRQLFEAAGLDDLEETTITAAVDYETFDEYWAPFELSVGPTAQFISSLDPERLARLRELVREELPPAPFTHEVRAWTVRGRATGR
jgi:ubiquinone/menaquinone biosynthesis C-methylase UbiE